ncbi:Zinc phosphodiesterase ELAC protein 2 [Irineochytrium annulatum]|nr:Zinc phosphodiesterase ELAC protein 2 [Irineochytrium annulatum]
MATKVKTDEIDEHSPAFNDENLDVHYVISYPKGAIAEGPRKLDVMDLPNKREKLEGGTEDYSVVQADAVVQAAAPPTLPDSATLTRAPADIAGAFSRKRKLDDSESAEESALDFERNVVELMFNSGELVSIPMGPKSDVRNWNPQGPRAKDVERLPSTAASKVVISYICQAASTSGKFLPDVAKGLGAQSGKEFGLLYGGMSIKTKDGVEVFPNDCMGPDKPGLIFFIIACPSLDYVPSLVNDDKFAPHYYHHTTNPVSLIIHMVEDDVLNCPEYREWALLFGESTQHIVITKNLCAKTVIFRKSAMCLCRLNMIDGEVFSLPFYDPVINNADVSSAFTASIGVPLMIYNLAPKKGIDLTALKSFDHTEPNGKFNTGLARLSRFMELCMELPGRIKDKQEAMKSRSYDDVCLTPLGTAACLPSKVRNVSSTHIYIPNYGGVMLDAGEGTYGQLFRKFNGNPPESPQSLRNVLKGLRVLFISHMHADHHLGVCSVILRRKVLFDEDGQVPDMLYVVGPPRYRTWLEEYSEVEDLGMDRICFIPAGAFYEVRRPVDEEHYGSVPDLLTATGLTKLTTVTVEHCPFAYACSMTHSMGWKIVFSGDCRPSSNLVRIGQNADVLIHEATFENNLCDEATKRRHSTIQEAATVCEQMGAKNLLLTHFSGRTPRIPSDIIDLCAKALPDSNGNANDRRFFSVGMAFDLMTVSLGNFWRLPLYMEALAALYPPKGELVDLEEGEDEADDFELSGKDNKNKDGGSGSRGGKGGRGRGGERGRGRGGGGGPTRNDNDWTCTQ